jgi:hypothetical protein
MAIYRAKVAVLICPLVPDADTMLLEILHICIACYKPKQFIYD